MQIARHLADLIGLNLEWQPDPETTGGLVVEIPDIGAEQLRRIAATIRDAGYVVSTSVGAAGCDDQGVLYLWVAPGGAKRSPTTIAQEG